MKILNIKVAMLFMLSLFLFSLFSCDSDDRIDLAENPEERQEVYQQILNDEQLFTEFMDEMRENDQSMQWMRSNRPMIRNIYGRRHMQQVMANHPEVVDTMLMQGMMMQRDTTMYRRNPEMQRRMIEHMIIMMERDTSMYRQMQERMQNRQQ